MNKKVLVVGFGVEGKALVNYFLKEGDFITIADQKREEEMDPSKVMELRGKGVDFVTGEGYLDNLKSFNLIAFSPGLRPETLEKIYNSGVKTITQLKLFFEKCPTKKIIGVTGTNGKGTTATMIYEILKRADLKVFLGGNIGIELLPVLDQITSSDWVIIELSSYQLRDLEVSPHIGVLLNITPDHLDMHKSFKAYVEAKANIIRYQKKSDFAVINGEYNVTKALAKETKAKIMFFSKEDFLKGKYALNIPGAHNRENAAAALKVAKILKIDDDVIRQAFENFEGLPHRLQRVSVVSGVEFFDDSISTTPETVIAAINSFTKPKILILGGSRKSADYTEMAKILKNFHSIKALILIGVTGSDDIPKALNSVGYKGVVYGGFDNFDDAVRSAFNLAQKGEIILLSPGSASFDWFKDYKDRGDQFKKIAEKLASENK